MKKDGFTLVELLAVIVILGVILVIAVPNIISTSKKSRNKMYDNKTQMIEKAAELYGNDKYEEINKKDYEIVSLKELINGNYLKKENNGCNDNECITDPRTNQGIADQKVCICTINKDIVASFIGDKDDCNGTICDPSNNQSHGASGNIKYKLEYNVSSCSPQVKNKGESWGELCIPTKDGYEFLGWFTDENYSPSTEVKNGTNANSNLYLYAKWQQLNKTLIYHLEGGNGCQENKTGKAGEKWGELCIPTRSGYTFKGWFTNLNEPNTEIKKDSIITNDIDVHAKWIVNKTLDLNGYLNGTSSGNLGSYGVVDVYIDGKLVQQGASDFYAQYPVGTMYEFKNPRALSGYKYNGLYSGSLSGIINDNTNVVLSFSSDQTLVYTNVDSGNGTISPSSQYIGYNQSARFTVTPNNGYYLSNVICDQGLSASGYSTSSNYVSTTQYVTISNTSSGGSKFCRFYFIPKEIKVNIYYNSRKKRYPYNNGSTTSWEQELGRADAGIYTDSSYLTLHICEALDGSICSNPGDYGNEGKIFLNEFDYFNIDVDMLDRFRGTNNRWYNENVTLTNYSCTGGSMSLISDGYNGQCSGYSTSPNYSCNTSGPYDKVKRFKVVPYSNYDTVSCNFTFSYGTSGGDLLEESLTEDLLWP